MEMSGQPKEGAMHVVRHVLRAGLWVTFALLIPAAASAVDTPDLRGRWKRNADLSQDAVSKVFASLALEGRGFSPDEQRFHDALLKFVRVIDSLQIELTAEDVKIILSGVLGGRLEVLANWRGNELIIQEKNEFGKLVQSLSLNREGRLAVLLSLDDRRLRAPLLLLSLYDRVPAQP
jgi:hypothetical protein